MKIVREYKNYKDYLEHQKEKTLDPVRRKKWQNEEWQEKIDMFYSLFMRYEKLIKSQENALCMCARTGQEVMALKIMGVDAIGVDLVPCLPLVAEGDIHNLKYSDNNFGFVFSNSFDHSLAPDKFLKEMVRVMKPNGIGMLHLQLMEHPDKYAENILLNPQDVIDKLNNVDILISKSLNGVKHATYHWEVIFKKC